MKTQGSGIGLPRRSRRRVAVGRPLHRRIRQAKPTARPATETEIPIRAWRIRVRRFCCGFFVPSCSQDSGRDYRRWIGVVKPSDSLVFPAAYRVCCAFVLFRKLCKRKRNTPFGSSAIPPRTARFGTRSARLSGPATRLKSNAGCCWQLSRKVGSQRTRSVHSNI